MKEKASSKRDFIAGYMTALKGAKTNKKASRKNAWGNTFVDPTAGGGVNASQKKAQADDLFWLDGYGNLDWEDNGDETWIARFDGAIRISRAAYGDGWRYITELCDMTSGASVELYDGTSSEEAYAAIPYQLR